MLAREQSAESDLLIISAGALTPTPLGYVPVTFLQISKWIIMFVLNGTYERLIFNVKYYNN